VECWPNGLDYSTSSLIAGVGNPMSVVVSAFVIEQFCGFFSDPIDYDMQLHSIDQPIAGLSGWMSRWILRYIGF